MRCKKCGMRLGGERLCPGCDYDDTPNKIDQAEQMREAEEAAANEEFSDQTKSKTEVKNGKTKRNTHN